LLADPITYNSLLLEASNPNLKDDIAVNRRHWAIEIENTNNAMYGGLQVHTYVISYKYKEDKIIKFLNIVACAFYYSARFLLKKIHNDQLN
jgi:hypothetical protein